MPRRRVPASPRSFPGHQTAVWALRGRPGRPPGWGAPLRPVTSVPRALSEPRREQQSHHFQPGPGKLDRAAARALGSRRSGPRGHIILGRGCVRSGRPRRHRATSVPPGRAAGEAPCPEPPRGWASAGSGRDPGGDPARSLGPAGRRRRAGCGGDHNLFRGNETATVGRGSISQACPLSA